jgi:hypothetical protein
VLAAFRDEIRALARAKAPAAELLAACDRCCLLTLGGAMLLVLSHCCWLLGGDW